MEAINIKYQAHLTENHQLKAADELIAKLKYQLGQERSFNDELEEQLKAEQEKSKELEKKLKEATCTVKSVMDKYSRDVNEAVKLDSVYANKTKQIEELKEENARLERLKDLYFSEIMKLKAQIDA